MSRAAGRLAVLITRSGSTCRLSKREPVLAMLSEATIMKLESPARAGVPEMVPFAARLKPDGSEPEPTAKVKPLPEPPFAVVPLA